jgi:hypothetical protein
MDVAELTARKADVQSGITAASQRLRVALLSGADTAAIRLFLSELQDELRKIEAEIGIVRVEAEAAEVRKVEEHGRNLAADTAHRLKVKLEALQPPPAPVPAKVLTVSGSVKVPVSADTGGITQALREVQSAMVP